MNLQDFWYCLIISTVWQASAAPNHEVWGTVWLVIAIVIFVFQLWVGARS